MGAGYVDSGFRAHQSAFQSRGHLITSGTYFPSCGLCCNDLCKACGGDWKARGLLVFHHGQHGTQLFSHTFKSDTVRSHNFRYRHEACIVYSQEIHFDPNNKEPLVIIIINLIYELLRNIWNIAAFDHKFFDKFLSYP